MRFHVLYVVTSLAVVACGPSKNNGDDTGIDALNACAPEDSHRCQGSTYQTCTGGQWQTAVDCEVACVDSLGCVQCAPNEPFCKDGNVWACDENGTPIGETTSCGGQTVCIGGSCLDACMDAAANKSYIGCEYWAVDLDNAIEVWSASGGSCTQGTSQTLQVCYRTQGPFVFTAGLCDPPLTMGGPAVCPTGHTCGNQLVCASNAQASPFAIVVSNPQAKDATVTVTGPGGQVITRVVPAGQVSAILPQMGSAIPDQSVDGSFKSNKAYKITSDLPVVAYQFNPLDNSNVFSNDASLMIPRATFDTDYYVMSWPTLDRRDPAPGRNPYYGYLTIVAWQDNTQIAVTPTAAVTASANVAPIAANTTASFTLNAFEVLQLQASGTGDLTGTHITSPNMMSFGVFGGHEATAFGEATPPDMQHPNGPGFADHLEEMLFPSSTWGKTFAITRSQQRSSERDHLRILAQMPNTTITFTPPPSGGTCGTLGPGQFCDVQISGDTEISSNEPVLVGHFLQSATWWNNGQTSFVGTGDPSMALAAPSEQFRKEYTILVPAQYAANYVSIAATATGGVTVDGTAVTLAPFPGGGTHRAARVPLAAGQHTIRCADGCGITVYGWSDGVSYMFAGGLDLKPIVIL
jgi:hypothetical protein